MKFDLREVCSNDHEWLVELHNDELVLHNLTNPEPISMEDHLNWWNTIQGNSKQKRLIFTVDGERAGFTKFYNIDRKYNNSCDLGADLDKQFRGKGLGKEMWKLMIDVCFNEYNLHRIGLTTAEYNEVAHRIYLGLGFKVEGKLHQSLFRNGKYWDMFCMFMLKTDWLEKNG